MGVLDASTESGGFVGRGTAVAASVAVSVGVGGMVGETAVPVTATVCPQATRNQQPATKKTTCLKRCGIFLTEKCKSTLYQIFASQTQIC
jgi:hypothetical protein